MSAAVAEAAYRLRAGRYAGDPARYATVFLGVSLTPQQRALPAKLLAPPYRTLMPSANNVGKTFALAALVNWHHDSFDPGAVLATSASYRQVTTQLFKEVRRLRPLGIGLKPRHPEVYHHERHFALGFSTNKPDAFQGHHEGALLIVMDEATGVPSEFADRAETMWQGVPGHYWVAGYNPNDPTTWPYVAEQSGGWSVLRLSALDHPNILAELRDEPPPYPGAVRLKRVRERIDKECQDCGRTREEGSFEFPAGSGHYYKPVKPEFSPQVLGVWPLTTANALWADADRRRCETRPEYVNPRWPVQIGCDVARSGGNRTAFAVRRGLCLVHLEERTTWPTNRINQHIGDRLRELCHRYCPEGEHPRSVPCVVDVTGGYGAGVVDYPEGYNFLGVNSSQAARDPNRFPNTRSELWQLTRDAAGEGGFLTGACGEGRHLLPQLWKELTAVRYSLDKRDRRVMEGKQTTIDRLGLSPDLADALNLSYYPVSD